MSKKCSRCDHNSLLEINMRLLNKRKTSESFDDIQKDYENVSIDALKRHYRHHLGTCDKGASRALSKPAPTFTDTDEECVKSAASCDNVRQSVDESGDPGDARRAKLEAMLDQAMTMYSTEMRAGDYKAAKQSQPIILGFLNAIAAYDASHGLAENNQDITLRWADDVKGELQIKYYDELIHEGKGKALPAPDISARK